MNGLNQRERALLLVVLGAAFVALLILYPAPDAPPTGGSAPVAQDDVLALPTEVSPATASVTTNDSDPDGDLDSMSVAVVIQPEAGTAHVGLDGSITYTPSGDLSGNDDLQYEVCDAEGRCDQATVTIRLRSVELSESTVRFAVFGDYGDDSTGARRVAELVAQLAPDFIVTTGDNSYDSPQYDLHVGKPYSPYIGDYVGEHGEGADVNRFFPALGDHEYSDGGVEPYLDFFSLPGEGVESSDSSDNERYYDFTIGPVQVFVLNTQPQEPDGTTPRSIQGKWLQAQLTESVSPWRLVVSALPPFSSGNNHGSEPGVQWPYDEWGADAVFSGDDHVYERIVRAGLPYFVSGLGGRSLYGFDAPVAGSEFRYADDFGVLMVEACDGSLIFEFHSLSEGVIDRFTLGEGVCLSVPTISDFQVSADS